MRLVLLAAVAQSFGGPLVTRAKETYAGGLLGVNARVTLDRQSGLAHVTLNGRPLLGTISGSAWIQRSGEIALDETLQTALSRRLCSVDSVYDDAFEKTLTIYINLPLFGLRRLVMKLI